MTFSVNLMIFLFNKLFIHVYNNKLIEQHHHLSFQVTNLINYLDKRLIHKVQLSNHDLMIERVNRHLVYSLLVYYTFRLIAQPRFSESGLGLGSRIRDRGWD